MFDAKLCREIKTMNVKSFFFLLTIYEYKYIYLLCEHDTQKNVRDCLEM